MIQCEVFNHLKESTIYVLRTVNVINTCNTCQWYKIYVSDSYNLLQMRSNSKYLNKVNMLPKPLLPGQLLPINNVMQFICVYINNTNLNLTHCYSPVSLFAICMFLFYLYQLLHFPLLAYTFRNIFTFY